MVLEQEFTEVSRVQIAPGPLLFFSFALEGLLTFKPAMLLWRGFVLFLRIL